MKSLTSVLIANRGEIAIRIARAAHELGMRAVAVHAEDDGDCLHVKRADHAVALTGSGPAAYLDIDQLVRAALAGGCDALHPGYGFASERADLARACEAAGLVFVGPQPDVLDAFGDKARARALAQQHGVPILPGTIGPTEADDIREFVAQHGPTMIKALAGGGGRGMRAVERIDEVEEAVARCRSEGLAAFGNGEVYAERLVRAARHVEVQILGDGTGTVSHLWDRDCSVQRRNQKLIEIAPCPGLPEDLRRRMLDAAVHLASSVDYRNAGTFEFLVDLDAQTFAFIEANARLQVEHTVTEEVTGTDIVQAQLRIAGGATLAELGLTQHEIGAPRGHAIQVRVNLETMTPTGEARPSGGTITVFEPPSGPGVRVDTFAYTGYRTSPRYDSLLAKVIAHSNTANFRDAVHRASRALRELRSDGVATNASFLGAVLSHRRFTPASLHTRFIDEHLSELIAAEPVTTERAGPTVDRNDPLAVLLHGKSDAPKPRRAAEAGAVVAPMQGTVISVDVSVGDRVRPGRQLVVMEAMKMEHVIAAAVRGLVSGIDVAPGDTVYEGDSLVRVEPSSDDDDPDGATEPSTGDDVDLDRIRPDLAEVIDRHLVGLDGARPDAVERRRKTEQRTARENLDDLVDPGSYIEYAPLVIAAQRRRRSLDDLIARTPADGMVAGIGTVNADLVGQDRARAVVLSYDYTVLAGTQGLQNHRKKDRLFELAEKWRLPVVLLTEGGGGRPGDTDGLGAAGLDCMAFHLFGRLSGLVPLVGINSGRCFAGNAALLGCCDVVIATDNSNIGMGGPAMIEGGGLGVYRPEEVGPMEVQVPNGVVDIAVRDEAEACAVAKKYLSYFQGPLTGWECADQRLLRHAIPENRLRMYDVRKVIETMADQGSVLELRRHFGPGMVTALVRFEGRPAGVVANNPAHLAGAIDSDGADKAARFLQMCDAHDLPVLFLCDTPGMMVGPEVEKTALVRHCSRLFVVGSNISVPFFTIVLRKGYGLGAQAMAGGSFKAGMFTVAWPTGEFGGMGLEGSVKLGYRNELAAIEDATERKARFDEMVARAYAHGKALSTASFFEIDDVIDPAESRRWIMRALKSVPPIPLREGKKRPCVDTW